MNQSDFVLRMNDAMRQRRAAELLVREAAEQFEQAERGRAAHSGRPYNLVRAINCSANGGLRDGYEFEVSSEKARQRGTTHDPHRIYVPIRALQVGTAAQGGYLVGTDNRAVVETLFPASTVIALGANVISGLAAPVTMPTFSTAGTANWAGELGTSTAAPPVVGQIACQPYSCVAVTEISRPLLVQSAAEPAVGQHLARVVGNAIDYVAIQGNGTNQPTGIINTDGIHTQSGATFSNAKLQTALKAIADKNAVDANVRFLADTATRSTLSQRALGTSAGLAPFIWQDGAVAGKPAFASANVPGNMFIAGDFSQLAVLLWGDAIRIEVNPYANFQAGIVSLRVVADVNVAVMAPGAFSVSTSVS